MAPIIPDLFRAQVVFRGVSADPKDRFVNTFHFTKKAGFIGASLANVADEAHAMLQAFYWQNVPEGYNLLTFYNQKVLAEAEVRVYDLGDTTPRQPEVRGFTFTPNTTSQKVPWETAGVLSFRSDRRGPRGKGRIFLGPLGDQAMDAAGSGKLSTAFRNAAAWVAYDLSVSTRELRWTQLSATDSIHGPVMGGWIDDAPDTLRRRGKAASERTVWGNAYVLAA